jgi:hypothetical protein
MRSIAIIAAAGTLAAAAAAPAGAGAAVGTQYEGTVVSVDRTARTFRLHDSRRGTIRIRVTARTRYERVGGFAGLRSGLTRIEATVRRSGGTWVATLVGRSGGGGNHGGGSGGNHGGGHDDGPGHT